MPSKLFIVWGQSNATGATAGAGALSGVTYPSSMPYQYRIGAVANPPNWVNRGWLTLDRALGPDGVTYYVGPEITCAQRLEEVEPGVWCIYKCSLSSSGMEHWHPDSTFPTLDPDGKTAHDRMREEISAAQIAQGATAKFVLVMNGEADSANLTQANLYFDRMVAMRDFLQGFFPDLMFVIGRLNDTFSGVQAAIVRAAQDALAAEADFYVVDLDAYAMNVDNIHYPIASHLAMGPDFANAYLAVAPLDTWETHLTTVAQIRDRMIDVIEALTPTSLAGDKFRAYRNEGAADFRGWAEGNGKSAAWRRFQVRDIGDDAPPDISNQDYELRSVWFEIRVSYPQTHRAGRDAALDRDDVMAEDQHQIENAVGMRGRANFIAPNPIASWVEGSTEREVGDGVDFLVIRQRMIFYRDMT